ncbi:hypothetical protein DPSP01_010235 [Paraphaeosphaeria sporulosa]|uniref:Alpha/beta hydrolase fold-3 domain-containing protein n=1 Tax=Paraphaeosphaeria sporulosa TaxID=1460663 RepID=A0A177C5Y0_9PLEO|nr:uncharacterized protein CC84DRAFT_1207897 [Paraphaeosphaeria sporulosa]OAG03164.1 hypothetical protein CC84DRAFT_1207897 [Paraphaeosphaeria sporulosa]
MFYFGPILWFVVVNMDYRLAPQAKTKDFYRYTEDCASWCRQVLPTELGDGFVDPEKLIIGGSSCGAQLAFDRWSDPAGSAKGDHQLVSHQGPTNEAFTTPIKPSPLPGRTSLIVYDEFRQFIGPDAPMASRLAISCKIPDFRYWGQANAYFYMLKEGIYLESVYGTFNEVVTNLKWNIPVNLTERFPPVLRHTPSKIILCTIRRARSFSKRYRLSG